MPRASPNRFEAWRVFPLGLKIRLTLDYQSEGCIMLPWVLWKPVFKKLQVKVRELGKQYGSDSSKILRAPFFGK